MAKGKHATALFEVIHSARRPPLNSPAAKMPVPRSWWKGRAKRIDSVENLRGASVDEPLAFIPAPAAFAPASKAADSSGADSPRHAWDPKPQHAASEQADPWPPQPQPPEQPQYIDHIEPTPIEPMSNLPPVRSVERSLQVNSGDGAFSFRLSYGGAAAAGFILLLLIAIAFLAGTRATDTAADDETSASATARDSAGSSNGSSGMLAAVTPSAPSPTMTSPSVTLPPAPAETPAPASQQPVVRQVGLNYVIVQSYPSAEAAQRAADFLIRSGVPCTVKQGLPGWTLSSWYSIIGTQPFDHVQHNPDLDRYKDRVRRIGEAFAGHNTFNRFDPTAYRWRAEADDDTAQ